MTEQRDVMTLAQTAEHALNLVGPSILLAISGSHGKNIAAHVVIPKPGEIYTEGALLPILAEKSFGEPNTALWRRDFRSIAQSKASVCWRTGMSSRTVGEKAPYLYRKGDTKFPGGVVCDGLIVAVSGLEWQMDEAVAHSVIAFFWAMSRMIREGVMGDSDQIAF